MVDGLWLWRQPHPAWNGQADWEPEVSLLGGRVPRRQAPARPASAAALRPRRVGAHRRLRARRGRDPQARSRPRRRPDRALVRRPGVRADAVLARRHPADRARAAAPRRRAARRPARARRRPRDAGDAAVPARAARAGLRRRHDRARRRAARVGLGAARAAHAAGAARAAGAAVRARARLARRARPHAGGFRGRARTRATFATPRDEFSCTSSLHRHDQDLHRRLDVPRRLHLGPRGERLRAPLRVVRQRRRGRQDGHVRPHDDA